MKRHLALSALVGFGLGAAATAAWSTLKSPVPNRDADFAALEQRYAALKKQSNALEAQLRAARLSSPTVIPQSLPEKVRPVELDTMMSGQAIALHENSFRHRFDALALRLKLNSSQQAYAEQKYSEMAEALRRGEKVSWDSFESLIVSSLSPEQKQMNSIYREEKQNARVEMLANNELNRLQSSLALSEEQKEGLFQKLAELHASHKPGSKTTPREFQQMRIKLLSETLTPDQMRLYEAQTTASPPPVRAMPIP